MNKSKYLISLAAASLVATQAHAANWSISGWLNEGLTYYDDGQGSDVVQTSDNGTTLSSRITLAGDADVGMGIKAGFEVILEPQANETPLAFSNQGENGFDNATGHNIGVLGNSVNLSGHFGKVTLGLQSMPTDNIAVLDDPSLTLWQSIAPVFRGNGFTIRGLGDGATNTTWGSFLNCLGTPGLQIGMDCNGIYRQGIRYDLPELYPGVSLALGYANDDIYDIALKFKGELARLQAQLALGYSMNNGASVTKFDTPQSLPIIGTQSVYSSASTFQIQGGLMDVATGIFGTIAYQQEDADDVAVNFGDSTDAYWLKIGVKRAFNSMGDSAIAFQYGSYNDQFGAAGAQNITGSEVKRIGLEVSQYFGSRLIIYGVWENLELNVDCTTAADCSVYSGADDLNTFTLGTTFFF